MAMDHPEASCPKKSSGWKEDYERTLEALKRNPGRFQVFPEPVFEPGSHPENFVDYECAFAARNIRRFAPRSILDIGSYRHFLLGLQAHFPVTTLDVRKRRPLSADETVLTGDAKKLNLPDRSFDLALSLCTLEHLGLGRYGDDLDFEADAKAFREMVRVLKTRRPSDLLHHDHPRPAGHRFQRPPDLQLRHAPGILRWTHSCRRRILQPPIEIFLPAGSGDRRPPGVGRLLRLLAETLTVHHGDHRAHGEQE